MRASALNGGSHACAGDRIRIVYVCVEHMRVRVRRELPYPVRQIECTGIVDATLPPGPLTPQMELWPKIIFAFSQPFLVFGVFFFWSYFFYFHVVLIISLE